MSIDLAATALWQDAQELPASLSDTIDGLGPQSELAELLSRPSVRRIVATGNGASWYAAAAFWLASLSTGLATEVTCVPAGLLAANAFDWREGDVLLAFSSSGKLRDVRESVEAPGYSAPFGLITANAGSALGRAAEAHGLVVVRHQRAVTHTQAYLGAALVALDLLGRLSGEESVRSAVRSVPELLDRQIGEASTWADELSDGLQIPAAALAFGTRQAWPAAMEAALLLKETSIVPAEGMETREGATSGMYALSASHLVLGLGLGASDHLVTEALRVCGATGARTLRVDPPEGASPLVAIATLFLHPLAMSIRLALSQGRDPDQPGWYAAYQETAWSSPPTATDAP
jgi:glucosamine 6-phosphate synthetase-like amidotransferase/phosphosugar isomerase protein